ncbi:hypothetical protein [Streptosporangium lutulentum]|uniref:Uncharacterized protein n=1 Tax=Streptosporangium lutulentum TaxID=1461250 RepID=A0ABT9Q4C1_9ACTN|nr:hypothetical protein [Streptosporangium lutulentum]MDP9841543.1 hypothetical protein [Streptosporangium lutulentum]
MTDIEVAVKAAPCRDGVQIRLHAPAEGLHAAQAGSGGVHRPAPPVAQRA